MQRSTAPGTGISIVQSSATSVHPSSRAAWAGNSLRKSGVTVKIALSTSPGVERVELDDPPQQLDRRRADPRRLIRIDGRGAADRAEMPLVRHSWLGRW